MSERVIAELVMMDGLAESLFSPAALRRIEAVARTTPTRVLHELASAESRAWLREAEVLVTGWGCPALDEDVLASAPRLRAIVHACGSVKHFVTPACWERGIAVSSAVEANAKPVAEYALAMILLAGTGAFVLQARYREERRELGTPQDHAGYGNYGRRVGIVGASRTGRRTIELLAPHDVEVLVHDPFLDAEGAHALGARLVELDELLATCDVVSLHAPALPSTHHMLDRRRLGLMRDGATFINTARGSLVDHDALLDELRSGRLNAILDVTDPVEPPAPDSPLWELPNVVLTPHVAGALGNELLRQGDSAVAELERYAAGEAFAHPVHAADLERLA